VGCGDGGCAAEFARAGARVTALDVDPRLVQICAALNEREGLEIHTSVGDITDPNSPGLLRGPFDIVLLRDVVEHIEDLELALRVVRSRLTPEGVIYVVFPPYYSPYGAHQQILPKRKLGALPYNKLPYIQLLPEAVFRRLVAGDAPPHREVARLRRIRLTLHRFHAQIRAAGLRIRNRKLYLLRPSFKLRYGLPVLGAGFLGRIPVVNEIVVTGAHYLLERETPASST